MEYLLNGQLRHQYVVVARLLFHTRYRYKKGRGQYIVITISYKHKIQRFYVNKGKLRKSLIFRHFVTLLQSE